MVSTYMQSSLFCRCLTHFPPAETYESNGGADDVGVYDWLLDIVTYSIFNKISVLIYSPIFGLPVSLLFLISHLFFPLATFPNSFYKTSYCHFQIS